VKAFDAAVLVWIWCYLAFVAFCLVGGIVSTRDAVFWRRARRAVRGVWDGAQRGGFLVGVGIGIGARWAARRWPTLVVDYDAVIRGVITDRKRKRKVVAP
jgi:hypothetical protein